MARGGSKELKTEKVVSIETPEKPVAGKKTVKQQVKTIESKPAAQVSNANLDTRAQKRDERLYEKALDECIRREKGAANVSVEFKVGKHTFFGQMVKVVGENDHLGAWDPKKAIALKWGEGDIWKVTLDVPRTAGQIEYKYIVVDADRDQCSWEGGNNRVVQLPKDSSQEKLQLQDIWS